MKRSSTDHLDAWRRSAEFRAIAKRQCKVMNAAHSKKLRCGAHAKSTGQPCTQHAMANGRCYVHGGRTPSGDAWHTPLWPDADAANAMEKMHGKVRDRERAARKKAKKIAVMNTEERRAHERWKLDHMPGSARARAMRRKERRDVESLIAARNSRLEPTDAELLALEEEIVALRSEIERLKEVRSTSQDDGVLG